MSEQVFYNVWRTDTPADRAQLVEKMREEAPALAAKAGFVALIVLECEDDGRVLAEGHWASREAFDAAVANDEQLQASRRSQTVGHPRNHVRRLDTHRLFHYI